MTVLKKTSIGTAFALVAAFAAVFLSAATPSAELPRTIGVILPLTGDFGFFGEEARRGIELAFEEIEKAYPARFQLVIEDDGCKAKNAVTAYEKLVTVERRTWLSGRRAPGRFSR